MRSKNRRLSQRSPKRKNQHRSKQRFLKSSIFGRCQTKIEWSKKTRSMIGRWRLPICTISLTPSTNTSTTQSPLHLAPWNRTGRSRLPSHLSVLMLTHCHLSLPLKLTKWLNRLLYLKKSMSSSQKCWSSQTAESNQHLCRKGHTSLNQHLYELLVQRQSDHLLDHQLDHLSDVHHLQG